MIRGNPIKPFEDIGFNFNIFYGSLDYQVHPACVFQIARRLFAGTSIMMASPWPPPLQIAAMPVPPPLRFSS
ncbi:Uncharacterised protein [Mycobacteroides abscessus subsp. abscessus]|nr:Uncharacterised protein [Mycobacteroides abscessus subsp. abscessus]